MVSAITVIDGLVSSVFDGLPTFRFPLSLESWEAGSSGAPSLIKRYAAHSGHKGPVLDVLAMLAAKRLLRVAPCACALPLTATMRRDLKSAGRDGETAL